jgi:hypothetical protein
MLRETFKETLLATMEARYNIEQPYVAYDRQFEFFGTYNQRNAKYFASKKLEYYAFSNFDYVFYKSYDHITCAILDEIRTLGISAIDDYVNVDGEHMESTVTYMLYADHSPTNEVLHHLKSKSNYSKSYQLGLKGWAKLKIIILVPTSNEVYTNRYGKGDKRILMQVIEKFQKC